MELAASTWTDAGAVGTDLAVLPVGSTEQHGPHAPLSTDTLAAEAVAAAGAAAFDGETVVAPAIPVGISEEHRGFAGTLWLAPDTFRSVLRDVLASLAAHGWTRAVIVNGHGGNVPAVAEVAAAVSRSPGTYAAGFTWFDAIDVEAVTDGAFGMGHAGAAETAVVMASRPDLVREDRLAAARDGAADRWGEWVGGTNLAYDSADFAENGAVGDPTLATPERGEALLDAAGEALAEVLAAVAERDLDGA